jgi:hypothetical protein
LNQYINKFVNANRAKKRMDKEDVFGSLIQVNHTGSKTSLTTSPPKSNKVLQAMKIDDTLDLITEGPERVSRITSCSKKETKNNVDSSVYSSQSSVIRDKLIPQGDRHHVAISHHISQNEQCDEDLEEILCKPSNLHLKSSSATTCISTSGTQSLMTNATSNYAAMWQHPYYQSLLNLPPQIPPQGLGYPLSLPVIGAQHITASWLANLHNFTVLEQQKGGVDIMVSNLDETVSNKDLKKKLASVFREHCKVQNVFYCLILLFAYFLTSSIFYLCVLYIFFSLQN